MDLLIIILLILNQKAFANDIPFVHYPFHAERGILCDQGALSSPEHSHSHVNTLYAVDFATPKNADPAGIFASIDGYVIAYDQCVQSNEKECGAGFGNTIKILREDGILVLYSHLDKVAVKTGDYVQVGQFIGVEGNTGWTGFDNRHLHFSVHRDWRELRKKLPELPGISLDSIPFKMNICQENYGTCTGKPVDVRDLKCKRVTGKDEFIKTFNITR